MLQLIYKSSATVPFSSAELARLLMKTRVRNDISDVTGILLYHANVFLQVLEGPADIVEQAYERISLDPRHKCLQQLGRSEIEQRSFPGWSMGFVCSYGNWLEQTPGFEDFFNCKGSFTHDASDRARRLLMEFRYNPWRRKVDLGYAALAIR